MSRYHWKTQKKSFKHVSEEVHELRFGEFQVQPIASFWKLTAVGSSYCSKFNATFQGYAPDSSIQGCALLTLTRVDCLQLPRPRSSWNWIFVVHEHSPQNKKKNEKRKYSMKTWRYEEKQLKCVFNVSNGTRNGDELW